MTGQCTSSFLDITCQVSVAAGSLEGNVAILSALGSMRVCQPPSSRSRWGKESILRITFTHGDLVCVVTVEKQPLADTSYSEMLSVYTLFVVPGYARHKHILSYSILLNYQKIGEYQYAITENVITSYVSWLLFPLLYPFWGDIEIGSTIPFSGADLTKAVIDHDYGPRSKAVEEATRMFFLEAHRDGIF